MVELLIWAFLPEERARAPIDRSKSKSAAINALHPAALHGTHSGRMSQKKCVFGCEGKITLFSFPKNPASHKLWMKFVFPGQQQSFSSVFVEERFTNKAQFDAGFAHCLLLKDGAVPAIKYPGHDSELQTVNETTSNVCVLLMIALKYSSLFSSVHGAPPPGARLFLERIVKLHLSFINMIKLNTFWRHEGCSTTLYVLKINMRLGETVCYVPFKHEHTS